MKKTVLFLLFISALWACSDDQKEMSPSTDNYTEEITVFFENKTFHLKGRLDKVAGRFEYEISEDLKAVETIYEQYSELSTVIKVEEPNKIYLFENNSAADSYVKTKIPTKRENNRTLMPCVAGTLTLYDGSNFSGYSVQTDVWSCSGVSVTDIPMFEHPYFWGKDRKITVSSVDMTTGRADDYLFLTLYEHINYGGKSLQLFGKGAVGDTYLASYPFSPFHSWNDKASSLKVEWRRR